MVIGLFGNKSLTVTEAQAHQVDKVITRDKPPVFLKITGELVKVSEINGIWEDATWEEMQHESRGDTKCLYGYWHPKGEGCAHRSVSVKQNIPGVTIDEQIEQPRPDLDKNEDWQILKRNQEELKRTGIRSTEGVSDGAKLKIEAMKAKQEEWLNRPAGNQKKKLGKR